MSVEKREQGKAHYVDKIDRRPCSGLRLQDRDNSWSSLRLLHGFDLEFVIVFGGEISDFHFFESVAAIEIVEGRLSSGFLFKDLAKSLEANTLSFASQHSQNCHLLIRKPTRDPNSLRGHRFVQRMSICSCPVLKSVEYH